MFKGNYFINGNDQRAAFQNFCDLRAGIRGDPSPPRRRGCASILTLRGGDTRPRPTPTAGFLLGQSKTLTPVFALAGHKLDRTDDHIPTSLNISLRCDQRCCWVIPATMLIPEPPASGPHLNYITGSVV